MLHLEGQTFGYLKVLSRDPNKKCYWICQCQHCEEKTIKSIRSDHLTNGETISCGCIQKEVISKLFSKDLTNQMFGAVKAIKPVGKDFKHGDIIWQCQCTACGKIFNKRQGEISELYSCGCLKSKGEFKINKILIENNINFKTQYSFPDLLSDKNFPLLFDFAIFKADGELSHLIEYNGKQHYEENNYFNRPLKEQQKSDNQKIDYCLKHNIPLIVIPYWDFDKINLERLINI